MLADLCITLRNRLSDYSLTPQQFNYGQLKRSVCCRPLDPSSAEINFQKAGRNSGTVGRLVKV